jgi:hypothetical protein
VSDREQYDAIAIHMLENHGVDLLDSEINDLIHVCAPALQHAGQGDAATGESGWQLREVYFDNDLIPTAYRTPQPAVPDVDDLAQELRRVNGFNSMGAGDLAEHIVAWLSATKGDES